MLGGLLGGIGKIVGGALVGGILGGLFGGKNKVSYSQYTPPHVSEGIALLQELLRQAPELGETIASLRRPYIEKFEESVEGLESKVSGYYDDLISQTQDIVNREIAKQSARLGALGLLNTPASQYTTADILDKLKLEDLRTKTSLLSQIAMMKPKLYAELSEYALHKSPRLATFQIQTDLVKALFGAPTIVQPTVKEGLSSYIGPMTQLLSSLLMLRR